MKQRLLNELKSNGFDCLNASLQKTCCGTSIVFSMTNLEANQKPITINGVSVLMDDEMFFARAFWTILQNIFGHCCMSNLDKVAMPRLETSIPAESHCRHYLIIKV